MLKLQDLRKTTRRAGDGDLRIVYPKFLRDRTLAPRIDMAVRYLEAALGRWRAIGDGRQQQSRADAVHHLDIL